MARDPFPLATSISTALADDVPALVSGQPSVFLDQVTPTTAKLVRFWFQQDFCELRQLNFHEGQRDAILAIIYAHEVVAQGSLRELYETLSPDALLEGHLLSEVSNARSRHPKYAAKMATGTGKTWVLNALLVWQYLNHLANPSDERFSSHFLLVAPGLIVYDRLLDSFLGKERHGKRRFEDSDIFLNQDLFIPDDDRDVVFGFIQGSIVTKGDIGRKVTSGGMIAITNWHLLAGEEDPEFVDYDVEAPGADIDAASAVESLFPITPGTSAGNALDVLDRRFTRGGALQTLKDLPDLVVFNDEAHHIHELKKEGETTEVEWQKSLLEIAEPKGHRFVQIDFSATPYNEIGSKKRRERRYFPHIVVDFDLNSAMRAGLVKSLALDKRKEIASLPLEFRAERDERGNVIGLSEGQRVMLRAGLKKLQILETSFADFDASKHPKMMIVCEDTSVTDYVVQFLKSTGLSETEILAVDTNRKGEMGKAEWEKTRERLFDIDRHDKPKVIVSVLMLREGFDVNNICVIVPLRSTTAQILLEQTVGRGLRLMWRGDERIEEAKAETRERFRKHLEPTNFFDVLFVVEHPAFTAFYDDLLQDGLAVAIDEKTDKAKPTGDVEAVHLRDGFEKFDFRVPFIVRDAEEEMRAPSIDPLSLQSSKYNIEWLLERIGKGDRFVSEETQSRTQFGDYRVESGVMTATGYNDYLGRMTKRIAEALSGGITKSAKTYSEISRFPFLQVQLSVLTGWVDAYIRNKLFDRPFDPLAEENWRVLLLDDVAGHIAGTFASALIENEGNQTVEGAEVHYRLLSEVDTITVKTTSFLEVEHCIYPKLPIPTHRGGLERRFAEWVDRDTQIEAFVKINEYKHAFLQRRYLKADGMPAMYSPDFLVRNADYVYIVETKAQRDLINENVIRKQRAAIAWCEQLNALSPELRDNREWYYVILGEDAVKEWQKKNARVSELLEYARLRRTESRPTQETML